MAEYETGSLVVCRATFTDPVTGAAVTPSAVSAIVTSPSGVATTYVYGVDSAIQLDSTGHFHVNVDVDENGTWVYRFESTGTYQGAREGTFYVF